MVTTIHNEYCTKGREGETMIMTGKEMGGGAQ